MCIIQRNFKKTNIKTKRTKEASSTDVPKAEDKQPKYDRFLKILSAADLLENGLEDTGRGKGKLGRSERVAWTYIHYQT